MLTALRWLTVPARVVVVVVVVRTTVVVVVVVDPVIPPPIVVDVTEPTYESWESENSPNPYEFLAATLNW